MADDDDDYASKPEDTNIGRTIGGMIGGRLGDKIKSYFTPKVDTTWHDEMVKKANDSFRKASEVKPVSAPSPVKPVPPPTSVKPVTMKQTSAQSAIPYIKMKKVAAPKASSAKRISSK